MKGHSKIISVRARAGIHKVGPKGCCPAGLRDFPECGYPCLDFPFPYLRFDSGLFVVYVLYTVYNECSWIPQDPCLGLSVPILF